MAGTETWHRILNAIERLEANSPPSDARIALGLLLAEPAVGFHPQLGAGLGNSAIKFGNSPLGNLDGGNGPSCKWAFDFQCARPDHFDLPLKPCPQLLVLGDHIGCFLAE